MSDSLLFGVTVLDLTQGVSGPYAAKLMADYGAAVIKVERPGAGDVMRRAGPFPGDLPHLEKSGSFLYLNTNKRGLTLNLATVSGQRILRALAAKADILIESSHPGEMESWGLGYDALRSINPSLVMASVSNFGQTGPYRDYEMTEIIAYATGVSMHCTGVPDREPLKLGGSAALMQAGNLAAAVIIGAWFGVAATGEGEYIDYSLMESQAATVDRNGACLMAVSYSGEPTFRRVFSRRFNVLPFGAYPCADGYAHFTGAQAAWWPNFCDVVGLPEWKTDPRFIGPNFSNVENAEIVDEGFLPWILSKTKHEVMVECEGFAGTPINTMEDIVHDPHFRQRGFFVAINHPVAGSFEYPGAQFNPAKAPWRAGRAPLLGEHTEAILRELGYSRQDLVKLTQAGVI
ncbi:MAG: CoA transferase [Chloroflexi bacterium]|nr:CoA transferase [Chloroflexota bacterium]